jgi:hypothetical protein
MRKEKQQVEKKKKEGKGKQLLWYSRAKDNRLKQTNTVSCSA